MLTYKTGDLYSLPTCRIPQKSLPPAQILMPKEPELTDSMVRSLVELTKLPYLFM